MIHVQANCSSRVTDRQLQAIQGITIADHVRTGAGAVVVRDVEEAGTVVGVPARKIK